MSDALLTCRSDGRQAVLRAKNALSTVWNGIDYVEYCSLGNKLTVQLLCPTTETTNWGEWWLCCERNRNSRDLPAPQPGRDASQWVIALDGVLTKPLPDGAYTLHVNSLQVDPRHSTARFEVTKEHPSRTDVDPKPRDRCPPEARREPEINYLAKDYASLRQVLFDRLAQIVPAWRERHVPDIGVALVELLAYVGDYLSYFQDAVGTEAYLETARRRVSVKRHVRLIDYDLDEGCNARTFVHLEVGREQVELDPTNVLFLTDVPDPALRDRKVLALHEIDDDPPQSFLVFEPVAMPESCRRLGERDIKSDAGLIGWLAESGEWMLDLLPKAMKEEVRDLAATAASNPPFSLMSRLRKELDCALGQHCLLGAMQRAGCRAAQATLDHLNSLSGRTRRNRCLLAEATGELIASENMASRIRLWSWLNKIPFYTWSGSQCVLPVGATRATLVDEPVPTADLDYFPAASIVSSFIRERTTPTRLRALQPGDVLLFEELLGPQTFRAADADPQHRQAVRLVEVKLDIDPVTGQHIAEIEWHAADALRFPLCISNGRPVGADADPLISVARGNMVLVDHGWKVKNEPLKSVPEAEPFWIATSQMDERNAGADEGRSAATAVERRSPPFCPALQELDLTHAVRIEGCPPAKDLLHPKSHRGLPELEVFSSPPRTDGRQHMRRQLDTGEPIPLITPDDVQSADHLRRWLNRNDEPSIRALQDLIGVQSEPLTDWLDQSDAARQRRDSADLDKAFAALRQAVTWEVQTHLLDSAADDRHVVVEVDEDRHARLRFGDGELGRAPTSGETFWATYRVGGGKAGNIGADGLRHLVYRSKPNTGITGIRNPLAAVGGAAPETLQHARLLAPTQFREKLRRAITADDYANLVKQEFADRVQAARGVLDWTGSWNEVAVAVDVREGVDRDRLLADVRRKLEDFRRIGHRIRVQAPISVPLDIEITVCVVDGHLRAHVQQDLLDALGTGVLPNGQHGFFHPDEFTFGDPLYLSRLIRAARNVDGVENLTVTRFRRFGQGDQGELEAGVMTFGLFEIPRLGGDGPAADVGQLCLNMRGTR